MTGKADAVEIGRIAEIATDLQKYIVHIRGNPGREAELIRELMNHGWTQTEIANAMGVSQPRVSKLMALHRLIPQLFKRLLDGDLTLTAAYQLANLPQTAQQEIAKEPRISVRMAKEKRREHVISEALLDAMELPNPVKTDKRPRDPKLRAIYEEIEIIVHELSSSLEPHVFDLRDEYIHNAIERAEKLLALLRE